MDEGGIEPFNKAGGIPLCIYIEYFGRDDLMGRLFVVVVVLCTSTPLSAT